MVAKTSLNMKCALKYTKCSILGYFISCSFFTFHSVSKPHHTTLALPTESNFGVTLSVIECFTARALPRSGST